MLLGFSGKTGRRENWVGREMYRIGYLGGNLFLSGNSNTFIGTSYVTTSISEGS